MGRELMVVQQPPDMTERLAYAFSAWAIATFASAIALNLVSAVVILAGGSATPTEFAGMLMGLLPMSFFIAVIIAMFTVLPWPVLVFAIKLGGLKRGVADTFAGAVMGACLIQFFGWPVLQGGVGITLVFALAGAVGGLVYWLMAGRPQ